MTVKLAFCPSDHVDCKIPKAKKLGPGPALHPRREWWARIQCGISGHNEKLFVSTYLVGSLRLKKMAGCNENNERTAGAREANRRILEFFLVYRCLKRVGRWSGLMGLVRVKLIEVKLIYLRYC